MLLRGEALDERYLQIDHRVPYEVGGDSSDMAPESFMLIDASSQRTKSWSCEHCKNFLSLHDETVCLKCFWAMPEKYSHVAMNPERRVELSWSGQEVEIFDGLSAEAQKAGISIQELLKKRLSK